MSELHYSGDVRDGVQVGMPLGCDQTGRRYRVDAVAYDEAGDRITVALSLAEAADYGRWRTR